jgi:adenylosuccinate synthase
MSVQKIRKNSFAFCGGAYGDEGKGRIIDEVVNDAAKKGKVLIYRDNGGANAGHTVEFSDGQRVALHQLLSGVFNKRTTMILGKGMVIHPGDLLEEIRQVKAVTKGKIPAQLLIDEMAVLSLDTHRAYEAALKQWESGGKGSTGRGISPAYADILLRHPLRMRDLREFNKEKIEKHYRLYDALVKGLGSNLAEMGVPSLAGEVQKVGDLKSLVSRLQKQAKLIHEYINDVSGILSKTWADPKITCIFEKAQGLGLDWRWGIYPDVTASDTTIDGIFSSTEGVVDPDLISIRAGVMKSTYMSSVGSRKLPTIMDEKLAVQIREDAHEYGSTTKRPRDIAYIDLPSLKFFAKVGRLTHMVMTHMDIVYAGVPVQVCTHYTLKGKKVEYRPDQEFLSSVKPHYIEMKAWNKEKVQKARKPADLPAEAKKFLKFLEKELNVKVWMITTGPRREQGILF